ncbi:hypothetical protein [Bacillus salipaludis]|uniref:hypothetical protein n=1 Tax=Bacillus salipaludis TaxID=2547811 RepID=UPI002E203D5D|nr:hypothetical protein [Bacillus salipaludis]
MTQNITTGPHPGQPGACIAQYNHHTHSHTHHHHSNPQSYPHNHFMPNTQQHNPAYGYYGTPSWRPPGTSYPTFY